MYKPYWAHLNQIGAPVRLTDADGAVVWAAEYEPFGKTVSLDEDPDGDGETVTMNFRFPGQYYDSETGLNYNWHRYYDPTAGRYLQAEFSQVLQVNDFRKELNKNYGQHFVYAENNPLSFIDFTANDSMTFSIGGGGIVGVNLSITLADCGLYISYGFGVGSIWLADVGITWSKQNPNIGKNYTLYDQGVFCRAGITNFKENASAELGFGRRPPGPTFNYYQTGKLIKFNLGPGKCN
ncbi:MAG: hypothetical protein GX444_15755 [Myxococcales bacterium]|nr:hypothetical protein [Myxococcales bacterium]